MTRETAEGSPLPRIVWTFRSNWDNAPALAQQGLKSWHMHSGWDLRALDRRSVADALDPETVAWALAPAHSPALQSGLLRLALLRQYGGVWANPNVFCARPLDDWLPNALTEGFFAFRRPDPARPIATWFLASVPGGTMISRLAENARSMPTMQKAPQNLVWMQELFADMLRRDPELAAAWDGGPRLKAKHRFQFAPNASRPDEPPVLQDLRVLSEASIPVMDLSALVRHSPPSGSLQDVLIRRLGGATPSRKRIVLHVGLPKTATTTIQNWAETARAALAERGIVYPPTKPGRDHPKHQELVNFLMGKTPHRQERKPSESSRSDPGNASAGPGSALDLVLYDHGAPITLISAEGLTFHLLDFQPERLEALRARLKHHDVTLFVNSRDPDGWLRSIHQQFIVNPPVPEQHYGTDMTVEQMRELPRVQLMLDHGALERRLREAYGTDRIVWADLAGDWAERLCALLDAPDLAQDIRATPSANRGLSPQATELMRRVNSLHLDRESRVAVISALRQLEREPETGRTGLPPKIAAELACLPEDTPLLHALLAPDHM
ncbi:capsular polysaccharide synthesis protein [Amaricoccus macauensis]|uniref:capsular polysaccharide synthesis protein n=1 Tax=Amaricoccus macauensis TaxID=57001 RepID=UPI003C7B0CC0